MPLQSNARLPGLVDFLSLASEGRAPAELSDLIAPVLDQFEFIGLGKKERILSSLIAGGGALGEFAFAASLTVPAREAWFITKYCIGSNNNVSGDQFTVQPTIQMPIQGGLTAFVLGAPSPRLPGGDQYLIRAYMDVQPFIAPPTSILGGVTLSAQNPAGAFSVFGACEFIRLRF